MRDLLFVLSGRGEKQLINIGYDVETEGKYYLTIAFCDPQVHNIQLSGSSVVMNPYGHLPGRVYGLLPFSRVLLAVYIVLVMIWVVKCCSYRHELMSIHVIISVLLVLVAFGTLLHIANLKLYNEESSYSYLVTLLSLVTDSLVSSLMRCLVIVIAMGSPLPLSFTSSMGVARASLGSDFWRVLVLTVVCFCVSLWHSAASYFGSAASSLLHQLPSTLADTAVYYVFLSSMASTIDQLREKNQSSKLAVFLQLRAASVICIGLIIAYSVVYGYLMSHRLLVPYWKLAWFFNDGVDDVFYLAVLSFIMVPPLRVPHT